MLQSSPDGHWVLPLSAGHTIVEPSLPIQVQTSSVSKLDESLWPSELLSASLAASRLTSAEDPSALASEPSVIIPQFRRA
jgi:hypothetical protein